MKNKPLIFTIITILCLVEPLIKILTFKATTHFDFSVILSNLLMRHSFREILDFWLIFPIAGLVIVKLRSWSYFAFMTILSYIIYSILTYESYSWPYNSDTPFLYHYLVVGFSACVFLLFLSPQVREPFFDRRVRIWESIQRYPLRVQSALKEGETFHQTEILNLSKTGAFISGRLSLLPGQMVRLSFVYAGRALDIPVEVRHARAFNGQLGLGVQFRFSSWRQRLKLAKVIYELKVRKHPGTVSVKAL